MLALTSLGIAAAAGIGIAVAVKKGKINLSFLRHNVQNVTDDVANVTKNTTDDVVNAAQKVVKDKAVKIKETIGQYEGLLQKDNISDKTKQQVEHRLEVLRGTQADILDMRKLKSIGNTKSEYDLNSKKEKISKFIEELLSTIQYDEAGDCIKPKNYPYGLSNERFNVMMNNIFDSFEDKCLSKFQTERELVECINQNKDKISDLLMSIIG